MQGINQQRQVNNTSRIRDNEQHTDNNADRPACKQMKQHLSVRITPNEHRAAVSLA